MTGLSAPLARPLTTYSTAAFRRASSPVTSRMLYPLTVGILRITDSHRVRIRTCPSEGCGIGASFQRNSSPVNLPAGRAFKIHWRVLPLGLPYFPLSLTAGLSGAGVAPAGRGRGRMWVSDWPEHIAVT